MPAGRPTKYKPEYATQAKKLCALGATDAELADFFEVCVATINLWKIQHEEFSESLRIPKEIANDRVEKSLYQRAVGYEHDEVDIKVIEGQVVQTPIRKHYAPDTTAAKFWLINRRRKDWAERIEQDIKAEITETVDKEELVRRAIFMLAERLTK
jgi:hypothetical protein